MQHGEALPQSPSAPTAWVITVSDRCHAGLVEDRSGPIARQLLETHGLRVTQSHCVPDEIDAIQDGLVTRTLTIAPEMTVTARITTRARTELDIQVGQTVWAVVKAIQIRIVPIQPDQQR